jgi:alkylated DNA repair dioxygenase AlkB
MSKQTDLFPDLERTPNSAAPKGFQYRENLITEEEESSLASALGELNLKPFEFHGHLGNRRVASFGFRYDYSRAVVELAAEPPTVLKMLLLRVAEFAGRQSEEFKQVGVNEYSPGAGIGWHRDKPQFGIIAGISLLAPANLRFRRAADDRWIRMLKLLQPRSIYVLDGEARDLWEHSIAPLNSLRYSVTFQTLAANSKSGRSR